MTRSTKQDWLDGPGDLRESEVKVRLRPDGPETTVKVRGLSAGYSNQATSDALDTVIGPSGEQRAKVNTAKMEEFQFAHGCIDPTFTIEEAEEISRKYGPAFKKVISEIDSLSGVDKEAIEKAEARFPAQRTESSGSDVGAATGTGDGGPGLRVRTGA